MAFKNVGTYNLDKAVSGSAGAANAGAFTMLVSLILVPVISLITPKMKKEETDKLFECFEEKVEVPVKDALD